LVYEVRLPRNRRQAKQPAVPMPKRASEAGSGTPILVMMSPSLFPTTGVVKMVELEDLKDQTPETNAASLALEKVKETVASIGNGLSSGGVELEVNVRLAVSPLSDTVGLPLGMVNFRPEIISDQVIERSSTAMPVSFLSVTVLMNPAWLGVDIARQASSGATSTLRSDWRFKGSPPSELDLKQARSRHWQRAVTGLKPWFSGTETTE
jgi:hypothetical protein